MAKKKLNAETIGELDHGGAGMVIDEAINRMVKDLEQRGQDEKERKVVIEIRAIRKKKITTLHLTAKAVLPEYRTNDNHVNEVLDGRDQVLEFNPNSPENADQRTIDDEIEENN